MTLISYQSLQPSTPLTPAESLRRGIIGHNTKADLLAINKYVAYDQTGKTGKAVDGTDGLVGSLYGMDLYHSGNVQTSPLVATCSSTRAR
jgi:hypothetical protein